MYRLGAAFLGLGAWFFNFPLWVSVIVMVVLTVMITGLLPKYCKLFKHIEDKWKENHEQ